MSAAENLLIAPEQYLEWERAAERKSEYRDGQIYVMAGNTEEHVLITLSLTRILYAQLRGKPCRVYATELRTKVSATGLYTYPDVIVACGERRFEDKRRDTLLNPTVLIEVLSESTEAYDRGSKFADYGKLPTLREYVLVAQDRPRLEQFSRKAGESTWSYQAVEGLEAEVRLASIDCVLRLAEVYEDVEFVPSPAG